MEKFIKQKSIDGLGQETKREIIFDWPLARFAQKYRKNSTVFLGGRNRPGRRKEGWQFYFLEEKADGYRNLDGVGWRNKPAFSVCSERAERAEREVDFQAEARERRFNLKNYFSSLWKGSVQGVSLIKVWNVSLVGALVFGMFLMTFIYRYLGQGVSAVSFKPELADGIKTENIEIQAEENKTEEEAGEEEDFEDYVAKIMESYQKDSQNEKNFKEQIVKMTEGYPIENMAPFIAKKNKIVAAFMVAIAKKESSWGKHVPVLDGKDCYNYWGYRGIRKRMGTGGHTCFDSPEDAVNTVAKRLEDLIELEKLNTSKELVVWKCGYDCSWDNPVAVRKWIADVEHYFREFDKFKN